MKTRIRILTQEEKLNLADIDYVRHLITEVYPTGIVSIVADSFDYWNTITNTARALKDVIMARNGKVVFRPDTGDPVKVVCGYNFTNVCLADNPNLHYYDLKAAGFPEVIYSTTDCKYYFTNIIHHEYENTEFKLVEVSEAEIKGSIECLWEIFGGTITDNGYKLLDSHVGLIYGDSITLERAEAICTQLMAKGFASTNIVFGIGSFTYQYVTRDTDAYAVKATFARVNNKDINIFKKPKTGDGTKNSALGLVAVFKDENNEFYLKDEATWDEVKNCEYLEVFTDGKLINEYSLEEIRKRIEKNLDK